MAKITIIVACKMKNLTCEVVTRESHPRIYHVSQEKDNECDWMCNDQVQKNQIVS